METKNFQFKMKPDAHARLKFRAKLFNLTIGDFAEILLSSLEFRLLKAYEIASLDRYSDDLDKTFVKTILVGDQAGLTQEEFEREFREIGEAFKNGGSSWKPEVDLP